MTRTRAAEQLWRAIRWWLPWHVWPRPAYCDMCGIWSWATRETPAYSAHNWALLCEDCADINDKETEMAWADYYGGLL